MADKNSLEDFKLLLELAKTARSAAACLAQVQPDTASRLRSLKRKSARYKQALAERLAHEFLPPMERGDLLLLAQQVNRLTGYIAAAYEHLASLHASRLPPSAGKGIEHIVHCCSALRDTAAQLPNFRKSKHLPKALSSAQQESDHAEAAFLDALRDLYAKERDPVHLVAGALAMNALLRCCEAGAQSADQIEMAVMINT